MEKKNVRIFFLHKTICGLEEAIAYLHLNKDKFNYIWDEKAPDYLFVSEHIYLKKKYYKKFVFMSKKQPICIYHAGECIAPDMNLFDYAIVFDRKLKDGDRVIRIPAMIFHSTSVLQTENDITSIETARRCYEGKKGFCNFLYSNSKAHPMRDNLFYAICSYKKVDSLGGHLRNVEIGGHTFGKYDWAVGGIGIKKEYRFSIASENAEYEGYVTEKLLTSLQAHTIPIYWGDPDVGVEFNPGAFINVRDFDSLDAVINRIKEIEENPDEWCRMISQPWQTTQQLQNQETQLKNYDEFIENLFVQDKEIARRRSAGTYPSAYTKWFESRFCMTVRDYVYSLKRKMQKHN